MLCYHVMRLSVMLISNVCMLTDKPTVSAISCMWHLRVILSLKASLASLARAFRLSGYIERGMYCGFMSKFLVCM